MSSNDCFFNTVIVDTSLFEILNKKQLDFILSDL